jgi:hypothetical protein
MRLRLTTLHPTQARGELMDESKRKNNQQNVKIYLGAMFVVFIVAVFLVARSDDTNKISNGNATDTTSDSEAPMPSVVTSSTSFPALHFASSGRLPIRLRSFQLGISAADALSSDSNLVNCQEDKNPPSTSDPDINLCPSVHSAPTEFYGTLTFSRGRLVLVMSELNNISPEDSALCNEKALNQLGKPDVVVYAGPSTDSWVWIDGDVRVQYVNRPSGTSGARNVTAQLAAYPEFLPTLDTANYDHIRKDDFIRMIKRGWGEDEGQVILKPLPAGLPNLQLRMTPGQVRVALPGIVINTYDDHHSQGELDAANAVTSVSFWDGMLSSFAVSRYDTPARQFPTLRNKLIDELGTPSGGWPGTDMETINWEDSETKIQYMLGPKGTDGRPLVYAGFADKRLNDLQQAAMSGQPPKYQSVSVHSFF